MNNLSLNIEDFKGSNVEKGFYDNSLEKAPKLGPLGPGNWVTIDGRHVYINKKGEVIAGKVFGKDGEEVTKLTGTSAGETKPKEGKAETKPKKVTDEKRLNPNGTWSEESVNNYLKSVGGLEGIKGKTANQLLEHSLNYNLVKHSMNVILEQTDPNEGIRGAEKRLLECTGNEFESALVLDKNGKQIIGTTNSERGFVEFTKEQMLEVEGAHTFTHNHPSSRGFSTADLKLTLAAGVKEMRAVAPLSIYGPGTWVAVNNTETAGISRGNKFEINDFITEYSDADMDVREHFEQRIEKGGAKELNEAETLHFIECMMRTNLYERGKIEFFFEDLDGNRKKLESIL